MAKEASTFALCIVGLLILVLIGSAMAAEIEMSVIWTGTANQITFTVLDPGAHPDWIGYDLQRKTTIECGSEIILNELPLPRQNGQPTTYVLEDFDTLDNTLYEYTLLFVDAVRGPISVCDIFDCEANPFVGTGQHRCLSRGPAAIASGYLHEDMVPMIVDLCPGSCGLWAFVTANGDLLAPYIGTGQAVFLVGNVTCDDCGPEGCVSAEITEVVPITCQVANGMTTWGAVKSLYH
jgi:hypothetical protein